MSRRVHAAATWAVVVAVMAAAGACGGDDGERAGPRPGGGTTDATTGAATDAATDAASSEPTASSPTRTPSAPASGRVVATDGVSLQVPGSYRVLHEGPTRVNAQGKGTRLLELLAVTSGPTLGVALTLDQEASDYLRSKQYLRRPSREADVQIDGRTAFHYSGPIDSVAWVEAFGGVTDAFYSAIEFRFPIDTPRAYRDRLVAQVLTSVHFT